MGKKYNILWIDDKHEEMQGFKIQAAQNDLVLKCFKSREAGVSELQKNYALYDGILLDAQFLENENDDARTENLAVLNTTKESLLQLPKKFEFFVLTGQKHLYEDKTFNTFIPKYFRKGIADDINKLFAELKQSADKQADTQIRHKYQQVFDVCSDKYIGDQGTIHLLAILKNENLENAFENPDLYFNPLRKIMDDIFMGFNKYGILPDVFVKPSVALNESSKFLSGLIEKGYQLNETVFPKVISDNVRNILAVCQPAAHRAEIDGFVSQVNSPYLLLSVTYQLLDVIIWFKIYIDNNHDIDLNKVRYKTVDDFASNVIKATIQQDERGNYHCGEIILTYKIVRENNYLIGDEIRIIKFVNNTNEKTKYLYPKSALQTEK